MDNFQSRIAQAEQLAKDTATALESIRPPRANTPLEQLNNDERKAVEGWLKDVHLLLTHADCIGYAKKEDLPFQQREMHLSNAEGGLTALKMLVEDYKRTGKTLLERLTPPKV